MSKALLYKRESKKIKGIFSSLEKIVERAEEEVEDSMQLFRINNSLEKRMVQSKFPSFLLLTGKDKTEATLYRANLYGSIKLKSVERESALKDFLQLVN